MARPHDCSERVGRCMLVPRRTVRLRSVRTTHACAGPTAASRPCVLVHVVATCEGRLQQPWLSQKVVNGHNANARARR
jgi:hypothetical protein